MYFTVFVASVAAVSYAPTVKMYASSFLSGDTSAQEAEDQGRLLSSVLVPLEEAGGTAVNLSLSGDPSDGFAHPGETGAKIMDLTLKSFDADLRLNYLRLKIGGVDPSKVKNVYLVNDGREMGKAVVSGEYVTFSGFNFDVPIGVAGVITVAADLSEDLSPGERLNLSIEKSGDIRVLADGEDYDFGNVFPLNGSFLSVVRSRG